MTDSEAIDAKIESLPDWRGRALAKVREGETIDEIALKALIRSAAAFSRSA